MLTDPTLRSQVDALWDKFWTGGLSNPLDAIEQFSYFTHAVPKAFFGRQDFSTQAFGTFSMSN
jgi:hypothetical protein